MKIVSYAVKSSSANWQVSSNIFVATGNYTTPAIIQVTGVNAQGYITSTNLINTGSYTQVPQMSFGYMIDPSEKVQF